ncbi:MAG: CoA-transferase subunit beta [Anaerolineae bacterium]
MIPDYTVDELICVCISRQVEDGEPLAQGLATPLVMAGYLLARLTHAPNVVFGSAIGNTVCVEWAPLSIARIEDIWLGRAMALTSFPRAVCDLLFGLQPKEFFRPAQIDPYGNFNNIFMGGSYERPNLRLPGCGGIADVTTYHSRVYFYVPRHSRAVFVEKLDFLSGLGHGHQLPDYPGPHYLVSNLGQFDFKGEDRRMCLVSYHPGVPVEKIQKKTGFPLTLSPDLHETPAPTAEEVHLLREEIDPLGIRELETLSGARRRRKLREIIQLEIGN